MNWRPIETAPKDGTVSIGIGKDNQMFLFYFAWSEWHEFHVYGEMAYEIEPIKWMPLPSPPIEKE